MSESHPLATYRFDPDDPNQALEFLKRTRFELRTLRKVRVFTDHLQVFDVNGDYFEIQGLGYPDKQVIPVLENINTAFKPEFIHDPIESDFKEFLTGRRYPWAADRVM